MPTVRDATKPAATSTLPIPVARFFAHTPLLSQLCDQNGWMDEDSLRVTLLQQSANTSVYDVRFEEILKEGSGCECGRNHCWGHIHLTQTTDGEIIDARIIMGTK